MKLGPDIARVAALIGDPARANMLSALMNGQALTSSELALEAGISPATASFHLSKLQEAGLVRVRSQGRHRYWAMADAAVAEVLESLMSLASRAGGNRVRLGPKEPALRKARICYDHLAGDYGVRLFDSLIEKGVIDHVDGLVSSGVNYERFTEEMALELPFKTHRPVCWACLDWSVRKSHLAGQLGTALLNRFFALGWARRETGSRIVTFSADGERQFLLLTRPNDARDPGHLNPVEGAVGKVRIE